MRSLPLVHFSRESLGAIRSKAQLTEPDHKPQGLWLSVEDGKDGWSNWCESERFSLHSLVCAHDVTLRENADVLWLRSADDIDKFTEQYSNRSVLALASFRIDWRSVAVKHQGILIAPYIWERRLTNHTSWYYTWDCASGCIWDASAIESVRLIERPEKAA